MLSQVILRLLLLMKCYKQLYLYKKKTSEAHSFHVVGLSCLKTLVNVCLLDIGRKHLNVVTTLITVNARGIICAISLTLSQPLVHVINFL